jgi:diguanylate cyclase (GGDEF)-like protein
MALAQPGPPQRGQAEALASLGSALALADAHPDILLPPALFDELAAEQARAGRLQAAFETLLRAVAARDALGLRDAAQRAIAMEVRFKTERALADAQRQRELAQAESRRAEELDRLNAQLRATMAELQSTQALLTRRNTELKGAYAAMKDLSLTDPLTGLRNRRFLTQAIDQDIAHAVRQHESRHGGPHTRQNARVNRADLIFFLVDLDHFKAVNDTHGHATGDEVLVQFKDRLLAVFRTSDHIVRWGGEEFLVVARGTQRACAPLLAERLRRGVAGQAFRVANGQALRLTCSIGFACFPPDPAQPRQVGWMEVVERADQRLYQAKAGGRDRWVGESSPDPHAADLA